MRDLVRRAKCYAGLPFPERRERMVVEQLRQHGIRDQRVLDAMARVAREEFVLLQCRELAYSDCALPIDCDQTISQPYTVAFMCEALQLRGPEKVLEVGTGSGYGAAVLSHLAREVHTVEYIPRLAEQARSLLAKVGYDNVHVHVANGSRGLPQESPFDAIVVTAAAEALPDPYVQQLVDGGRVVIPLGPHALGQEMYRFTLRRGTLEEERLGGFSFVPLVGEFGHRDQA